jgi:hypothetical protein
MIHHTGGSTGGSIENTLQPVRATPPVDPTGAVTTHKLIEEIKVLIQARESAAASIEKLTQSTADQSACIETL